METTTAAQKAIRTVCMVVVTAIGFAVALGLVGGR
jgi:hypothetical protein